MKREKNVGRYNLVRHEGNPFNIDVWYPLVKDITFKTYFIPLEKEEGQIIYKFYNSKKDITYEDYKILESLEKKIDSEIEKNEELKKNGAFLRLIDRSPKDGDPYDNKKVLEEYKNNLQKYSKELNKDINDNTVRNIKNGKDALNLLLTSIRNHQDISDWIK